MFTVSTGYHEESKCNYKGEIYCIRDNGAVFRHSREGKILRKHDNIWTFGVVNSKGYLHIASELVHRIVAFAFLGEPPSYQHVVDHIDTNRQNNRPENLRWLTRLENALNNPITRRKIEYLCGSIEAFIENPSILANHINEDPNFKWMRRVTPEEARNTLKNLEILNKNVNSRSSLKRGSLGEWIFEDNSLPKRIEMKVPLVVQPNLEVVMEIAGNVLKEVEEITGIGRDEFSMKSKKKEYLNARVFAAKKLRLEKGMSDEGIGMLIGVSKSMVNSYINHTDSYLKDVDYYNEYLKTSKLS